ncbi:hypothetical protein [Aeromicrobium sp.]|uniref:hypothetical protein n=1 Tax=Aeromicrobium sp. TaxID=1871063 RepID=UPI003513DF58
MSPVERLLLLLLPLSFGMGFASPGAAVSPVPGEVAFGFTDPDITESSGLVVLRDGLVVTVNDSGDSSRIFTVDPATGDTVGVTRWQGEPTDDEALAPAGGGDVWVGDIGDNPGTRSSVRVTRVPAGRGERTVRAPSYELVYPDGPRDAETLLADPATGRLYIVSKEFFGRVYAAPARLDPDRPNRLTEVGRAIGIATDGAFWPDGRHLVVRNYREATVYTWPDLRRVTTVDLPEQKQGEGIAIARDGTVLVSSEGTNAEVLRVDLPEPAAPPTSESAAADGEAPAEAPPDDDGGRADTLLPVALVVGAVVGGLWLLLRTRRRR